MREILVVAVLLGCGKGGDGGGGGGKAGGSGPPPGPGSAAGPGAPAATGDACKLITKADAEQILGGPAEIRPESSGAIGSQVPSSIGCDWDYDRKDQSGDVIGGTLLQLTIWDGESPYDVPDMPGMEPFAIGTKGKINVKRGEIEWVQKGKTIELSFSGDPQITAESRAEQLKALAKKLEASL